MTKQHKFIKAKDLLTQSVPKWEYHVHTNYTDGKSDVKTCVEHAAEIGLERMVFTEHTEPWQAEDPDWFEKYVHDIQTLRNQGPHDLELIVGIEAPAISFDGTLEMTDEMREHAEFILGAAHRYPEMGDRRVRDLSAEEALEMEYKTLLALCKNPEVDAIAHIGATCMKYCGPFPLDLTREVVRKATDAGKAIEINHAYHQPLADYLKICIEEDAWIIPGSNAHSIKAIGNVYKALIDWQNEV